MSKVSKEQYRQAVMHMIDLARKPTDSGAVAAQVLLSAYSGEAFQLNVSRMSILDPENYENALLVIRGRYETGLEPHYLIRDGSEVFSQLYDQWDYLKLSNRAKVTCDDCYGQGKLPLKNGAIATLCPRCEGRGWRWPGDPKCS